MPHICRGKNIVQFGPCFITNVLQKLDALHMQNGQSLSKAQCHVMAHICHGKNIVQFGQSFLTNLLQIEAPLNKKPCGSDNETCSPCCRNVITASFLLVFSSTGNMEP